MATNSPGSQARYNTPQQVNYFYKDVAFNSPGIGTATGILIGIIPMGAQITDIIVNVSQAFNAGTTNVLTVGIEGDPGLDNILVGGAVAPGTLGGTKVTSGPAYAQTFAAADARLFATFTQTGAAATAGRARICIMFVGNNDMLTLPL